MPDPDSETGLWSSSFFFLNETFFKSFDQDVRRLMALANRIVERKPNPTSIQIGIHLVFSIGCFCTHSFEDSSEYGDDPRRDKSFTEQASDGLHRASNTRCWSCVVVEELKNNRTDPRLATPRSIGGPCEAYTSPLDQCCQRNAEGAAGSVPLSCLVIDLRSRPPI